MEISLSGHKERERLSWTILLVSFGIFLAMVIGVPVGIYQWIHRATTDPTLILQALEGTAQVDQQRDASRLLIAGQEPMLIKPGAVIINDSLAETLMTISSPDQAYPLGTIQIYPNSHLEIRVAKSPRYESSNASHRLEIEIETGHIRLSLAHEANRATDFRAHTPHGQFLLWEAGIYSLDVGSDQSQITVRDGKAIIFAPEGQLEVTANKRGSVGSNGRPIGPLSPEINLITNGSFRQPLEEGWSVRANSADESQSAGTAEIVTTEGTEAIRFFREGTGHAETGIYQLLDQRASDYGSIRLHLSAIIDYQSLGICGALGSECPLMIRIDYEDLAGNPLQWVQGFYYWIDPAAPNPTVCETCPPPRQEHEQHQQSTKFFYDSPNLVEELAQAGSTPARINSLSVYASGHTYDVQITEIELLAEE